MVPEIRHIGKFILNGKVLVIADPCHSFGFPENGLEADLPLGMINKLEKCKAGTWQAFCDVENGDFELRCWSLCALHEDIPKKIGWVRFGSVCVDSGQVGIFDADLFGSESAVMDKPKVIQDSFFGACCYLTFDEDNNENRYGGCFEFGAVSSSGYGDGIYPIYCATVDSICLGVDIRFAELGNDINEVGNKWHPYKN